jgi:hypothetical protein
VGHTLDQDRPPSSLAGRLEGSVSTPSRSTTPSGPSNFSLPPLHNSSNRLQRAITENGTSATSKLGTPEGVNVTPQGPHQSSSMIRQGSVYTAGSLNSDSSNLERIVEEYLGLKDQEGKTEQVLIVKSTK